MNKMLGRKYVNNKGCIFEIISELGNRKYSVKFENGFVVKSASYNSIVKGSVKNLMHPSVCNIGYVGIGNYSYKKDLICYNKWNAMINRCYSLKFNKRQPTYKGVTVCEEWNNFQNFAKWFYENYNPETMQGWHLDKDIICPECKIYSPETCCFVPLEINYLLINNSDKFCYGVKKDYNNYVASIGKNKNYVYLGSFKTKEEAVRAYKKAKEDYIKEVADKWRGLIAIECYNAMYSHIVKINQ